MKRADWSREKAFRIDEDGCLLWRGSQHHKGLPTIYLGPGQQRLLRRSILAMMYGRPLKQSERAIVTCGKALCCSPKCLKAVTHSKIGKLAVERTGYTDSDARRQKIAKARRRKWTHEQIADMRARDAANEPRKAIARSYNTTDRHLWHIFEYRSNVLHLPAAVRYAMRKAA